MMSANTGTPASSEQAGGNLRAINGIGNKTAKTLPKLGISNCAELAEYLRQHTAEELSELLIEWDVQVSAKKIQNEDWLGQAEKRAGQPNAKPAALEQEAEEAEEAEYVPNHSVNLEDDVHFGVIFKRQEGRWKVTTYDERQKFPEKEWGIEPAEWANWILRQMRPQMEVELASQEAGIGAPHEIRVEILEVRHFEVERYKKLATEVQFEVSGSKKDTIAAALTPFWIQVQVVDSVSNAVSLVASERGELIPKKFTYKKKLEFPTPAVGRYEVYTLVLLLPPVARIALHREFTLKVDP